jgi:signal transduction histidine kinase
LSNRIITLQHDYELDRLDKEIALLNKDRQLQQAKVSLQQREISQQRLVIIIVTVLLILVTAGSYMVFRFYRKVRNLNREISEQNEEITVQSEELREANEVLGKLNREISEQKEEIQAQAEELVESNQTIARINDDLEEKIIGRTAELRAAYQELDTFFYRSSHDFRRPLTTFMGLAEVAKVTVKDSMALDLFNKVNETAHSLDKMLVKLQSISLIGSQELIYSEVLMKEILQIELYQFRDEIQERQMDVKLDINLQHPFYSYPALIKIIIQNLIENAIAFSAPQHPLLKISVSNQDDLVVLTFEDNGQGIDELYLQRIFEMYFRANEKSKGNGLGLYIVKKIVDKLRGTVSVKSQFGKGTLITVTLPNQQPEY